MKSAFLFIFLFSAVVISAQDNSRGMSTGTEAGAKILVVPFEAKMLLSDINRKIGNQYSLNLEQIRDMFRAESLLAVNRALCAEKTAVLLRANDTDDMRDATIIFGAAGYKQQIMLGKEKETPAYENTTLDEGEIKTMVGYGQKFMGLQLGDTIRWETISVKHGYETMLIITQMDIKNTVRPESNSSATGYLLRWHFVLYDSSHNQLSGGSVSRWMPNDERLDLIDNLKARMRDLADALVATAGLCVKP